MTVSVVYWLGSPIENLNLWAAVQWFKIPFPLDGIFDHSPSQLRQRGRRKMLGGDILASVQSCQFCPETKQKENL